MTFYIITAHDKTLIGNPKVMWIFEGKEEAEKRFEFLCDNEGWLLPEFFELKRVYIKFKNQKEKQL